MRVEGESEEREREEDGEVGEEEKQRKSEEGTGAGSSGDGLSHRVVTGEEELNEDDDYVDGEFEEGRAANGMPSPIVVPKEGKEQHELTHLPFRSWCSHCVRGRARNMMHRKDTSEDRHGKVPRVALDYFYLTTKKK